MAAEIPRNRDHLGVALIARTEAGVTGTSRYVSQLLADLPPIGVTLSLVRPVAVPSQLVQVGRSLGVDLDTFFSQYPYRLPATDRNCAVYHLATQTLATVLLFQSFRKPVVVTVHDIIPHLVRNNRRLSSYAHPFHRIFDRLAMHGLKRAHLLLADSAWTKKTLVQELGIAPDRIEVVYLGVDTARFRPLEVPEEFWSRYGLDRRCRYLLYVGSEDPRKNLATLLHAFSLVSRECPELRLVKVGVPHNRAEHDRLTDLARGLGIDTKVVWITQVCEQDLPLFYNAADLYVMPSLYEGFGLPVVEALACGTRVVSSNWGALPEVAGADSVLCEPTVQGVADSIKHCLAGQSSRDGAEARVAWARRFSWKRTAVDVWRVYASI